MAAIPWASKPMAERVVTYARVSRAADYVIGPATSQLAADKFGVNLDDLNFLVKRRDDGISDDALLERRILDSILAIHRNLVQPEMIESYDEDLLSATEVDEAIRAVIAAVEKLHTLSSARARQIKEDALDSDAPPIPDHSNVTILGTFPPNSNVIPDFPR